MTIQPGEFLKVIREGDGWWFGVNESSGKHGHFPEAFVEKVPDEPKPAAVAKPPPPPKNQQQPAISGLSAAASGAAARAASFPVNNTAAATSFGDRLVRLWSLTSEVCLRSFEHACGAGTDAFREGLFPYCVHMAEGVLDSGGGPDKNVRLWSLARDGECVASFEHGATVRGVAVSPLDDGFIPAFSASRAAAASIALSRALGVRRARVSLSTPLDPP